MRDWCVENGRAIPSALAERPEEVRAELRIIYSTWLTLSGSRSIGMGGASSISVPDVIAYLELHGVVGEQAQRWLRLILAMDSAFLSNLRKGKNGNPRSSPAQSAAADGGGAEQEGD